MELFFHDDQLLHRPKYEFDGSELRKYPESSARINRIKKATAQIDQVEFRQPVLNDFNYLEKIHSDDYIEFLRNVPSEINGTSPNVFPVPNQRNRELESFHSKLGIHFSDPGTPVTTQTYQAAYASVCTAISSVIKHKKSGNPTFALCKPPGHHAMQNLGGGYCFFNNAAIAASYLMDKGSSVTILDLDFHHGNGTQEIFYTSSKVQYVSIHADPRVNYPYYWGSQSERGEGQGNGFNINLPVSNDISIENYMLTLHHAINEINQYNPDHVLVSMGFDCHHLDPVAGLSLTTEAYTNIGEMLLNFNKLSFILEGGYSAEIGGAFAALITPLL